MRYPNITCDHYVGSNCCNVASSGVWVCDAGPGGEACTIAHTVGEVGQCSGNFQQEFFDGYENALRRGFASQPGSPYSWAGFRSLKRAASRQRQMVMMRGYR